MGITPFIRGCDETHVDHLGVKVLKKSSWGSKRALREEKNKRNGKKMAIVVLSCLAPKERNTAIATHLELSRLLWWNSERRGGEKIQKVSSVWWNKVEKKNLEYNAET